MDPFVLWLTVALAGLAAFTGWTVRAFIAHLEKDIEYSRSTAKRGVEIAERATSVAERHSNP